MLLENLQVILVGTRFPENVGMAARACANMGCPTVKLVQPELWLPDKATPLATPKGLPILDRIGIHGSLLDAVADSNVVWGTTARTGGWRKGIMPVAQAAEQMASALHRGDRVALVFGPEDRGLNNSDIAHCHGLLNIPTEEGASSLNVAQAVLLVLHECASHLRASKNNPQAVSGQSQKITSDDMARLFAVMQKTLLELDCLHGDNPEYFFLPWKRLLCRAQLKRHEYDALMGLCRQVHHKLHVASSD